MLTWEQAEAMFPGCSALWDIVAVTLPECFVIQNLYKNAAGGLTIIGQSYSMISNTWWYTYNPKDFRYLTWTRF